MSKVHECSERPQILKLEKTNYRNSIFIANYHLQTKLRSPGNEFNYHIIIPNMILIHNNILNGMTTDGDDRISGLLNYQCMTESITD